MTSPRERGSGRADTLRAEFDAVFSRPRPTVAPQNVDLLSVRTGGASFAIRLAEVEGLHADMRIVPFESPLPEFIGLVGLRGALLPVYDLSLILGAAAAASRRFLVVSRSAQPVGLAFDELEGHVRVPSTALFEDASSDTKSHHLNAFVHTADGARAVLSVPSVVLEIARRCATTF